MMRAVHGVELVLVSLLVAVARPLDLEDERVEI